MNTKTSVAAAKSRDDAPTGSAGVPPAQHWHSLVHLLDPARPATAPRFRFGRAHGVPAGRVAGRHIAGKLSGTQRQCMRARRPRSRRGASSHPSCSARRHSPCRCSRAVPLRVPSVKHPVVNQDEPRINTKTSVAVAKSRDDAPTGSAGVPPAQHWHSLTPLLDPARPATAPRFRFSQAHGVPGGRVAGRRITGKLSGTQRQCIRARRPRSRRGASSHPSCSARRHCPCRCSRAVPLGVSSVKHPVVNQDEPRMNTNRHEDRWTCLAAMTSRDEGRERGRPARTTLAQPHPSPRPGSTGSGARIPFQPSPGCSRRQGGRAPYRRETERYATAVHSGETPALPEGRLLPSFLLREEGRPLPMRIIRE